MDTHGFDLLRDVQIPELNTRARLYRHAATGAELLSLENADENKCFGITFRTPPTDSTGVPHIMEHSVLSGSERFRAKDPFIELSKGSLKTFLNAFTAPDKTAYPVASTNAQDLYNLIDVYMDAVLHPLLTELTFQQEAWHYELDGPDSPLAIKGVVYNEMRGAYSSPDSLLYRYGQQTLLPDNAYGFDSGGDPEVIPSLTYEQFLAFHRTYYHPSNALIFFYGDDDPEERLRRMAGYLEGYERREVKADVALQPAFSEPRRVTIPYPVSEEEAEGSKAMVTVGWLLPEVTDPVLTMSMGILTHILIGTPASPLRKALIDSGLGEDLAGAGLENDLRQMYLATGLKGARKEDADRIEALILETLGSLVENGIEPEMIEAALNTLEFNLRENNTGRFPRGLSLMMRALRTWSHGADPLGPVAFEAPLNAIKERLESDARYFEGLVREHLVANSHRVTLVLEPDPGLGDREEAKERERLAALQRELGDEQTQTIVRATAALKAHQEAPDPPEVLAQIPSLRLEDLEKESPTIPIEESRLAGTPLLYHDLFTNGIAYLDLAMDLHAVPQDLLPYVSLFADALTEIGTEQDDYVRLSQRIGRKTGGIGATLMVSAVQQEPSAAAWLVLRAKSTMAQAQDLLDILRDILLTLKLDNRDRFRQMVLEGKASMEAGLVPGGHGVANGRLRANYSEADWLGEQTGGIEQLFFLRRLAQEIDSDWFAVLERLETLRGILLNRSGMLANVTLDAENWATLRPGLEALLDALPATEVERAAWTIVPSPVNEGLTIPAQVNYVAKGANLYDLGYTYDGSAAVISNQLRSTWLWERIRVQGGAYGGFCILDLRSGIWSFVSYRDPNLLRTVEVYDRTAEYLRSVDVSDDELTKSIIGTIGAIDAYQLPDAKGYTSMVRYMVNDTDELRQQRRDQVLSTTVEDFRAFADVLERASQAGRVVVLGSPEAIRAANAERGEWLTVTRVL
ncbi:MAG: peptidase M16 [Chloroflexi bacterium]|nr:peptidase M16 [Chloroflexota bacterium]